MTISLGLCNQKGGAAKTTTAAALAAIFGEKGFNVLAVDTDPQGHLSLQLGVDCLTEENLAGTVADLYMKADSRKLARKTAFEGVSLIPASVDLAKVEMSLPGMMGSDLRLNRGLESLRPDFDLIIIDSPPNLGKFAINVLSASDYYFVPVDGPWALRSVDTLVEAARENAELNRLSTRLGGIFLTMMDRTKIMQDVRKVAHERYGQDVLGSSIRRSTIAREAAALAQPLPLYAADSDVAKDYQSLAKEVGTRIGLDLGRRG